MKLGTRLAHYEITAHLGSGGMGDVYRATDLKLKRSVAVKLLPAEFAFDTERLSRFRREAQLLASLNHPNIAHIYGVEESGEKQCIVMELVEGETLQARLKRGPIPLDESLTIARQIAEALEAAHEKGVIHRDLKPGNVMLTIDGKVKVLDFGLAKAYQTESSAVDLSNSPTLMSMAATNAGVILGTAAYMSPEQAKGRPVDKRTDIFAFGCILFEMLSGAAAFDGEDSVEIIAQVVSHEPTWTRLPAGVPPRVHELLRLCLEKKVKNRRSDATDVRLDIEQAMKEPGAASSPAPASARFAWLTALFIFATIALAGFLLYERRFVATPEAETVRFTVPAPENAAFIGPYGFPTAVSSVSPDGRRLVFTAQEAAGKILLWIRPLDALVAQPLPGTDGASLPFWSPDSRWVGFFAQGKLKKVDVTGGPPQVLCDATGRGGTWNKDGTIVFAPNGLGGLDRVSSSGGEPVVLTKLGGSQTSHRVPFFLPDGRHFLFFAVGSPETSGIYIGALDSTESWRLLPADSSAVYAGSGSLLFVRQGTLFAQPFDPKKLRTTGDPVFLANLVPFSGGGPAFSVSDTGVLTYRTESISQTGVQLSWLDRTGKLLETVGTPGGFAGPDLSPDGKQIAIHRHDLNGGDIWIMGSSHGTMTRFTFDASQENSNPIWSPDGSQIVFTSRRNDKWGLYRKPSNFTGGEELLTESSLLMYPTGWAPDGKAILYSIRDPKTLTDIWLLPLTGDRKPIPLLNSPFIERDAQISPDGKWLAYASEETGRREIYLKPFPDGDGKHQISTNGGTYPRWRHDSKELFYFSSVDTDSKLMSVAVNVTGRTLEPAAPHELFDSKFVNANTGHVLNHEVYVVSPDGQRFLIPRAPSGLSGDAAPSPITVILNWTALLKRK